MSRSTGLIATPVQTRRDYDAFVDLPWHVPMDRPMVRPLREFERHLFDRGHRFRGKLSLTAWLDELLLGAENPFYEHGDLELFLARDGAGRPIARIAAIQNRLHNEYHHDTVGFFGFYQCVDGGETGRAATQAVVAAASEWLRARGLTSLRGPFNPTINDECGIWIDGSDYPAFLMPSNPRFYPELLRAAGLTPVKTLRVYRRNLLTTPEQQWKRWERMVERLERNHPEMRIRSANFADLDNEVKSFVTIFNAAWAQNWGFAPMSFRELRAMAELFQYMVDPGLIRAAEIEENGVRKMVGVMITLPDLNEILRYSNGRLVHPVALWKLLRLKLGRPTKRIRIAILGILPEYRRTPLSIMLLYDSFRVAQRFKAEEYEASWVLEDNVAMAQPLEDQGFLVTDHYQIFEKAI